MKEVNGFILGSYRKPPQHTLRARVYKVIFESDTAAGRMFDVLLLIAIVISLLVVMLDSVPSINKNYKEEFYLAEWALTILFTMEYLLRLWSVENRKGYIFSLYGLLDLIAILPTYLGLLFGGTQFLLIIRALRLLRIFRIFKMTAYLSEGSTIIMALYRSYRKISVFMLFIITLVTVLGSIMYLIERRTNGFNSIPDSIYWAIVTLTTVGYGDISPVTPLGKAFASFIMLCGYAIIAVPTGIVTSEITRLRHEDTGKRSCNSCSYVITDTSASYCANCGNRLEG